MSFRTLVALAIAGACAAAQALVVNVRDFGAKGDGKADDTAAIQRAIDAVAAAGAGKVVFPWTEDGYRLASPAVESVGGKPCRGQLYVPPGAKNLCFEGEFPCALLHEYQVRTTYATTRPTRFGDLPKCNTYLFGDWDAPEVTDETARPYALLSTVEGTSCAGKFSVSLVSIANLEFRAHLDKDKLYPKTSAVNLQNASRVIVRDSQFCLDDNVGDAKSGKFLQPNPCHTVGLMTSGDQNDDQVLDNVAVQGFRYGFVLGEHVKASYLYVHNCEEGIVFHDSTHLSRLDFVVAQHNRTILSTTRGRLFGHKPDAVNVSVGLLNFEGGQTTGIPPFVSHLACGVYDPGDRLRGALVWHEPWGKREFPVVGAKHFRIRKYGNE